MKIQAYLTAAAVNLKRLAAAIALLLILLLIQIRQSRSCTATGWDRLLQRPGLYASHSSCPVSSGAISICSCSEHSEGDPFRLAA
jgi:hypothetical protein